MGSLSFPILCAHHMPGKIYMHNCKNLVWRCCNMFTPNIFLWLFSAFLVLFGPMEIQARGEIWNGAISLESDSLICCSDSTLISGTIGETGSVTITDQPTVITLQNSYRNPVVITGGFNRSGGHLTTVRVLNVTNTQFEMRLIDWECRNPAHGPEKVPYIVVEAGVHTLSNGARLIAQNYSAIDHTWKTLSFPTSFSTVPAIFGQCISENESSPVVVGFSKDKLGRSSFDVQVRESGIADGIHLSETVSILAIEKGIYEYESTSMEVGKQELLLNSNNTSVTLERDNINKGIFIAGLQSSNSVVPATINTRFSTPNSVLMRLDFENCSGRLDSVKPESVSYINIIGQGSITACLPDTAVVDTNGSSPLRPLAVFTANPYEGNAPFEVSFDASSSIDIDGEIVSYEWNFGEGNTGMGMQTTHIFQEHGKYVVRLVVIDDQGLSDTSALIIDAGPEPIPPEAALSVSNQVGTAPFPVLFDATISSDPDGDIVSFQWTIGEEEIGTEEAFAYEFTEVGTYVVQLIITDDTGLQDTVEVTITVVEGNVPPTADFSFSFDSENSFQKVSFDASKSRDTDGQILSYKWDFGDGDKGEGKVVKHTYPDEGTYLVTLSVEDDSSAMDTYGLPVSVKRFSQDTTGSGVEIDCSDSTWVIGEVGSVTTTDQNERVISTRIHTRTQ